MHLHRILTRALTAAILLAITITAWTWWPEPSTSPRPAVVDHPATSTDGGDQFPGIEPAEATGTDPVIAITTD
ncbi:hypothetical protein [Nocardia higoensis]|uniref:hypothetical protein n=1 Tax=Nocardia higoensis TaxID=228599 RepID=UPI0002E4857B|nr:hypothetical protein [Nocardia higoensis]